MQRLPVKLLESGMIVAREVTNNNGIVLVNLGTELDDKLIFRLENMNIKKVMVKGCPVQLADYMPKTLDQKLEHMEIGFSRCKDDPLMQKFRVLVKNHLIQRDHELNGEASVDVPGALEETPVDMDGPTERYDSGPEGEKA
ncbi:MAG: hypothetical protein ACLFUS_07215 [Candidatus Sumerlaeia bacterium]